MKLNFNALPFVKSSQTVSRDKPISHPGQSLSEEAPPIKKDIYDIPVGGMRIPLDSVIVTVRRNKGTATTKRKWPTLPSSLEDLSPPAKLKRKAKVVSTITGNTPLRIAKRISGRDINSHASMIRWKQNALLMETRRHDTKEEPSCSSSSAQEVPTSPSSLSLFSDAHNYYDNDTQNTFDNKYSQETRGDDPSWKMEKQINFLKCLNDKQHGEAAGSVLHHMIPLTDPLDSTLPVTEGINDGFIDFQPTHPTTSIPDGIDDVGVANERISLRESKEYVIPVRDLLPSCEEERFDPNVFGIKMLFSREE